MSQLGSCGLLPLCIYCLYAAYTEIHSGYFCLTPFVTEHNTIYCKSVNSQTLLVFTYLSLSIVTRTTFLISDLSNEKLLCVVTTHHITMHCRLILRGVSSPHTILQTLNVAFFPKIFIYLYFLSLVGTPINIEQPTMQNISMLNKNLILFSKITKLHLFYSFEGLKKKNVPFFLYFLEPRCTLYNCTKFAPQFHT